MFSYTDDTDNENSSNSENTSGRSSPISQNQNPPSRTGYDPSSRAIDPSFNLDQEAPINRTGSFLSTSLSLHSSASSSSAITSNQNSLQKLPTYIADQIKASEKKIFALSTIIAAKQNTLLENKSADVVTQTTFNSGISELSDEQENLSLLQNINNKVSEAIQIPALINEFNALPKNKLTNSLTEMFQSVKNESYPLGEEPGFLPSITYIQNVINKMFHAVNIIKSLKAYHAALLSSDPSSDLYKNADKLFLRRCKEAEKFKEFLTNKSQVNHFQEKTIRTPLTGNESPNPNIGRLEIIKKKRKLKAEIEDLKIQFDNLPKIYNPNQPEQINPLVTELKNNIEAKEAEYKNCTYKKYNKPRLDENELKKRLKKLAAENNKKLSPDKSLEIEAWKNTLDSATTTLNNLNALRATLASTALTRGMFTAAEAAREVVKHANVTLYDEMNQTTLKETSHFSDIFENVDLLLQKKHANFLVNELENKEKLLLKKVVKISTNTSSEDEKKNDESLVKLELNIESLANLKTLASNKQKLPNLIVKIRNVESKIQIDENNTSAVQKLVKALKSFARVIANGVTLGFFGVFAPNRDQKIKDALHDLRGGSLSKPISNGK